jgi:predicted short-subunit dehydrogenase-like oxidoreductase (DUF2520 family)
MQSAIPFKIHIIGAGALAWQVTYRLKYHGFQFGFVYSRTYESSFLLASRVEGSAVESPHDFKVNNEDLVFCCTPDDVLPGLVNDFCFSHALVIHFSGTASLDVLKEMSPRHGVIYPFQTFNKERIPQWNDIPIFYEGNTLEVTSCLYEIASALNVKAEISSADFRLRLHLAGVLASNFSNFMVTTAYDWMELNGLNEEWLMPLMIETFDRMLLRHPAEVQTGPARRMDIGTMNAHLNLLADSPELSKMYKTISALIVKKYNGKEWS